MQINGIDNTDNEIINLLIEDGRRSYSDIGEKVGLSRTAVKKRIAALEEKKIIEGYKAIINPQEAPEMMIFLVNTETTPEVFETVKQKFAEAKETLTLVQTTGKCHLTAVCVSAGMKEMRNFINDMYKAVDGISYINANAVMDVIKGSITPE